MRILVVEDEFLVGALLKEELCDAGYSVAGPYTSVGSAREACRSETFDVAILDLNLNGQLAYPVADELSERGIPYVLLTGYVARDLPERFRAAPRIGKPHDPRALIELIKKIVQ